MADENKPAFYPRVGRNIAKNFRSAQPAPFIEDPRAMDLPQYGDVDLSVPSRENLEMARRMAEREAELRRQQQADRSPLEKLAGGLQAGRFMGSALTQAVNSLPTRIFKGDEAAEKFMQERIYKPEQPLAYEYAGDIGDFLEKLETEYKIPPVLPEAVALQYLSAPATAQAARAAGKGALQAGMALERGMEPVVRGALDRGGLPREMVMGMGANTQSNVMKPSGKGANWLDGKRGSVEAQLGKMKMADYTTPEQMAEMQKSIDTAKRIMGDDPEVQRAVGQMENELSTAKRNNAINSWIDSNLRNYVKNQMATPDDPVRKLAEEGILHMAPYGEQGVVSSRLMNKRMGLGQDPLGMGRSDPARFWERMSDISVDAYPAGSYKHGSLDESLLADNPWLQKIPDETMIYSGKGLGGDLGFDHIIDVLRQDVREGRIRPEQLNKVSMEQAVRRTAEFDQEMAKKMADTQAKVTEGMPVVKEYPETGNKWIQLSSPKELPKGYSAILDDVTSSYKVVDENGKEAFPRKANDLGQINVPFFKTPDEAIADALKRDPRLEDALKYEGDTMGHCVGGYCDDVRDGKSKIYSLRDAKGEPHVTIEVKPNQHLDYNTWFNKQPEEVQNRIAQRRKEDKNHDVYEGPEYLAAREALPPKINQIKGKGNAKPKDQYLPFVQDFVRSGQWSDVGDFKNTGLIRKSDLIDKFKPDELDAIGKGEYLTKGEYDDLLLNALKPEAGMKRGGKVSISNNPDTMMLELNNQKMKNGVPAYAGGKAVIKQGLMAARPAISEAERALPLVLPRALPKSKAEINAHAERVARQMMGEHVTSGKAGDTRNLAGRSMKESQRVKGLEYEIVPTKDVPESQVYQPQIGDINMALPGDFTLSDVELKSLQGEPVGSRQQGGSRYGLGHMEAETPLFYASNEVPAQGVQNKATDLSNLFGADRIIGQHMAMGPVATNFAQHFADANLRYTDYSKLRPQDMYEFDKIISEGFVTSKKDKKTGETIYKIVDFPDWPGIADPQSALAAMENNPEMRKWYNRVMQTPKITEPLGFPSGQDVRYAITSPDLRDMEVNLTGHGVGRLVPNAPLTDTAQHATYSKGIPGLYLGHQEVLTPFAISYPDAAQHIISTKNPQDFTGTIQKVFPHQRVDQQFMDEMDQYRRRIKELTGKKKGGAVNKAEGGEVTGDDLILEERPL